MLGLNGTNCPVRSGAGDCQVKRVWIRSEPERGCKLDKDSWSQIADFQKITLFLKRGSMVYLGVRLFAVAVLMG